MVSNGIVGDTGSKTVRVNRSGYDEIRYIEV